MEIKTAVKEFIAEAKRNVKLKAQQQRLIEQGKKAIHREMAKEWKEKIKAK